jgi:hypothetical protein
MLRRATGGSWPTPANSPTPTAHEIILCVANVSRSAQAAELDLSAYVGMVPVEMLGGNAFPPIGQLNFLLTLAPYGFYWFVLAAENQMPSWHVEPAQSLPDFTTLVLKNAWKNCSKPRPATPWSRHLAELAAQPPLVRRQGRGHRAGQSGLRRALWRCPASGAAQ